MTSAARSLLRACAGGFARGALAAALICLAVPATEAQSTIRVLVNDEPITSLDVQQRGKMMSIFTRGKEGQKEAVDQLIDERLMLQEAKRRKIEVTDNDVDQELAMRARAAKLTADQFTQALRQAGVNPQVFRNFLRANLAWQRVVRARFRATVNITEQDVTAALTSRQAPADEQATTTAFEYHLLPILFVIPKGSPAGLEAKRKSEANVFRSAFQDCDHALEQAAGKPDVVVQPRTRREEGSIPPALNEQLAKLQVGGVSQPERVDEGIQIVAICAKNPIPGQTKATVEVRQELSGERSQLLARRYLRDLRSDAVIEYR